MSAFAAALAAMVATHEQMNGSPRCAECGAVLDVEESIETFSGLVLCTQCHDHQPHREEQPDE